MREASDTDDVLEALASLPTLAHPTASPDGDEVAAYYDVTGRNELHAFEVGSGTRSQWSDGDVPRNPRWFVEWDADGDRGRRLSRTRKAIVIRSGAVFRRS